MHQASEFVRFVESNRRESGPVTVHCEAGIGRTGTMLATYLIAEGEGVQEAIRHVRPVEEVAVETTRQIQFLEGLPMTQFNYGSTDEQT